VVRVTSVDGMSIDNVERGCLERKCDGLSWCRSAIDGLVRSCRVLCRFVGRLSLRKRLFPATCGRSFEFADA
jgi:hypothetical protein